MAKKKAKNPVADATAPELDDAAPLLRGTVIKSGGGLYDVDVIGENGHETIVCSLRGILKKGRQIIAQPVSVGDDVAVRPLEATGADARGRRLREGFLIEVLPRRTSLSRARFNKTAQVTMANLDQIVVVMAMREPELNLHRLDRFLILAEASDIGAVICLNKIDFLKKTARKKEIEPVRALYEELGYTVLPVSSETDEGIEEVRAALKDKISAVLGSSGVGKSSLVNAVQPGLHLWVGDVMEIGKGRHTTTDVSLHPLDFGGYLADTPGIKTVSLFERDELDLAQCFPEFAPLSPRCRFNNCRHDSEPGCAVRVAVEEKKIAGSRYDSYQKMLKEDK